jgi:hypothetical protein
MLMLFPEVVQRLKVKLRKATALVQDAQSVREQHQQTNNLANKLAKQARNEVDAFNICCWIILLLFRLCIVM